MSQPTIDAEQVRVKRQLRLKIGRLRRRINGHIRGSQRQGRLLLSWRTYVKRYPAGMLAAAFGVGMATSTGLKGPRLLRSICSLLVRRGTGTVTEGVRNELRRLWEESAPRRNSDRCKNEDTGPGADNGQK